MDKFVDVKGVFGNKVSQINNPFTKDSITSIKMFAHPMYFDWDNTGAWEFEGSVSFKRGATKGEQEFKADNLYELFNKIYEFCMNL